MSVLVSSQIYSLDDFIHKEQSGNIPELDSLVIEKINKLANRVGAPSYQKTPVFKRYSYNNNKKKKINENITSSSWETIRNFKTTTLDNEIDKIKKKIKLIKLEAEGFEPEILQGLKKYLNYVEYITIDCGFERGIKQESTITECTNYLIQNNFEMIDFGIPRIVTLFKNLKS